MLYKYNTKLTMVARMLRRNMTSEEKRLWHDFLKKLPITVNRQKNIGNYIVDFYIAKSRTVIEIDGTQHHTPQNAVADKKRDEDLCRLGITVLRYQNDDIHQHFEEVCNDILRHIGLEKQIQKKRETT